MGLLSHLNEAFESQPTPSAERRAAFDRFLAQGLPTPNDEEWRYTNLAPLSGIDFAPTTAIADDRLRALLAATLPTEGPTIVFANGQHIAHLTTGSAELERGGIELRTTPAGPLPATEEWPADAATLGDLNLAFAAETLCLTIRRGTEFVPPIHIVHIACGEHPSASHPRCEIVLEQNARATVVETYVSDASAHLVNALTRITVGPGASLHHCRIQQQDRLSFHVGTVLSHQHQDSSLRSSVVSLGAKLARTGLHLRLDGSGAECRLDGLYVANGDQHVDHHTSIDHRTPHTTSNQLYKGVLDEHAKGVFNGKVFVRPGAVKTDARQLNPNLLLSDAAEIDTKPQLEIFADDVKCSHGATIGRLEETALFYLRARGISAAQARSMLIFAFANEMLTRIGIPGADEYFAAAVRSKLHDTGGTDE